MSQEGLTFASAEGKQQKYVRQLSVGNSVLFISHSTFRDCRMHIFSDNLSRNSYFGGARSKGFATLRNVSKLPFFDKIRHVKSVGFRFYSAI